MPQMRPGEDGRGIFAPALSDTAPPDVTVSERELRHGLDAGEFVVAYRPEVRIDSGEIVAVEALLRWRHPRQGVLEPAAFLPAAEETGVVVPLGAWVLAEACRLRRRLQDALRAKAPVVGVNLSPRQLADPDVVSDVAGMIADAGVDPAGIMFDVTEQGLLDDAAASMTTLLAFRRIGVGVAVDDFGTGYASLSILRSFPVDLVKIDRSIVAVLDRDPAAAAMCRAIVALSEGIGLDVSAEGVETAAQRDALAELGCTLAQGDMFGMPEPAAETLALIGGLRVVP